MVATNQLSKAASLRKGWLLPLGAPNALSTQYPGKSSLWQLIQYLSTGVFSYLSIEDWFKVPGVQFSSLPDAVEAGNGAMAFVTDAARVPDTLVTVGKTSGTQYGYSTDATFGDYGELTNAIFTPNGGVIVLLWWQDASPDTLLFALEGEYPDSGWNTIVVNGTTFARTDAGYAYDAPFFPGLSAWEWSAVSNPFSAEGEIDEVYFGTTGIQFNDPIGGGGSTNMPVFSDGSIWRAG